MRFGAGYGEIVDRAVHGQGADIAAGEFQRLHGEPVRGHDHIAGWQRHMHGVRADVEPGVGQMTGEQLLDQFAHVASAVAVSEGDVGVLHVALSFLSYLLGIVCN